MSLPARLPLVACAAVWLVAAVPAAGFAQLASASAPLQRISTIDPIIATQVNPRMLAGAAAVIVTGLLLLLYFYRRRIYILYWIAGWLFAALSMFLAAPVYRGDKFAPFVFGLSQFAGIVSALIFVISADAYRTQPRLRRSYAVLLMPVFIWFTLAPLALRMESVFAPGHLLIAGALAAAGGAHLALLRRTWLLGAAVVGTMLVCLAALNVWVAAGPPGPHAAVAGRAVFISLALYLVTALGMQLMTFEDMTYELRVANRRLEAAQSDLRQMVTTDPLTGCRNRRHFDEIIGREVQRHRRYNIPLSLLFIDVNKFKVINDTLGHETGDRVLQRVAAFLVRNVREADYVFRWGGDEFLILISCREEEAIRKGAELQAAFAALEDTAALPDGVGLSVGCAEVPEDADNIHALVNLADERMYAAKKRSLRARA
jgi:diguanylate cyclase (GGDEF)-like protein